MDTASIILIVSVFGVRESHLSGRSCPWHYSCIHGWVEPIHFGLTQAHKHLHRSSSSSRLHHSRPHCSSSLNVTLDLVVLSTGGPPEMASSSQSTARTSSVAALEPFRDAGGMLPLVPCHKCGTQFISRVSQKTGSKGKRFYKCPLLEHVSDFIG